MDPCLYVFTKNEKRDPIVLVVWVDDMLVAAARLESLSTFKSAMAAEFRITDLGPASWFLSMRITRAGDVLTIDQESYIDELLVRFGLANANRALTPLQPGATFQATEDAVPEASAMGDDDDVSRYRELIGALLYVAIGTRPDISFAVGQLSRFLAVPMRKHMGAARQVLRYLRGTKALGLTYGAAGAVRAVFGDAQECAGKSVLVGYADASHASDVSTRRSVGAYVFFINGGAVAWRSHLQPMVTLSSTEAEYVALSDAAQEAVYLRNVLAFLDVSQGVTIMFEDNQPCIHIATNPVVTPRVKHVDTRYHFVREQVVKKKIALRHVESAGMLADVLTKALARPAFCAMRDRLLGLLTS